MMRCRERSHVPIADMGLIALAALHVLNTSRLCDLNQSAAYLSAVNTFHVGSYIESPGRFRFGTRRH